MQDNQAGNGNRTGYAKFGFLQMKGLFGGRGKGLAGQWASTQVNGPDPFGEEESQAQGTFYRRAKKSEKPRSLPPPDHADSRITNGRIDSG